MNLIVLNPSQRWLAYGFVCPGDGRPVTLGKVENYRGRDRDEVADDWTLERLARTFHRTCPDARLDGLAIRVPFGGSEFDGPVIATPHVVAKLAELVPHAPLHLPAVLALIDAARISLPDLPVALVFETSFFVALPPRERFYAIDPDLLDDGAARRYGYHGLFHQAACAHAAAALRKAGANSPAKILSICLEPGPEVAAVLGNSPLTVSGGTTPLEGLPGETSCGEMDPGIILDLCRINGWGPEQINTVLTRQSGLLGLAGRSVTLAEVLTSDSDELRLARDVERYRILLAVGAGIGAMGGLDAIVFSGRYSAAGQSLGPWLVERISKAGPVVEYSCVSSSLEILVAAQAGQVIEPGDLPRPAANKPAKGLRRANES